MSCNSPMISDPVSLFNCEVHRQRQAAIPSLTPDAEPLVHWRPCCHSLPANQRSEMQTVGLSPVCCCKKYKWMGLGMASQIITVSLYLILNCILPCVTDSMSLKGDACNSLQPTRINEPDITMSYNADWHIIQELDSHFMEEDNNIAKLIFGVSVNY